MNEFRRGGIVPKNAPPFRPIETLIIPHLSDIAEALCNLIYLIRMESEQPDRVRYYASASDERIRKLIGIVHVLRKFNGSGNQSN
jgi:hypothetical protein